MHKRCGAKTRDGDPCKSWGMSNGRCRMHGGSSLKGPAHPSYKDGSRSKYMPKLLAPAFEGINPDEVLDLTETIMTQEAIARVIMEEMNSVVGTVFSENMQDRLSKTDESKRKLVETEMKRREKMREAIQIEDAVMLYRQLVQANKDEILNCPKLERKDAVGLLNAIVGRFATIAGLPDPTRADPGD